MTNSYFKPETIAKIEDLMEVIWNGNRTFDRACSVLKVKFNMYNLENVLHQEYAHFFPAFSDKIVEFMEGYNQHVIYPQTMRGDYEYVNPIEMIIQLREYFTDFRAKVYETARSLDREDPIEFDLSKYLEKLALETLEKAQRIIKIENLILGSLRPDSTTQVMIDLDNYVQW